jgi:hypothetical protein
VKTWLWIAAIAGGALTDTAAAAGVPSVDEPVRTGVSAPADAAVVVGLEDYAFPAGGGVVAVTGAGLIASGSLSMERSLRPLPIH